MAVLIRRSGIVCSRLLAASRPVSTSCNLQTTENNQPDQVTHTGQVFQPDDYRRVRFTEDDKLVTPKWAVDMIAEDPVVVCTKRVVSSSGGGPLGHPKVYINLDQPGIHPCGYSGTKFVLKKYYDEKTMGPSITHEEYLRNTGKDH